MLIHTSVNSPFTLTTQFKHLTHTPHVLFHSHTHSPYTPHTLHSLFTFSLYSLFTCSSHVLSLLPSHTPHSLSSCSLLTPLPFSCLSLLLILQRKEKNIQSLPYQTQKNNHVPQKKKNIKNCNCSPFPRPIVKTIIIANLSLFKL